MNIIDPNLVAAHLIYVAAGKPGSAKKGRKHVTEIGVTHRAKPLPCYWCGHESDRGVTFRVSQLGLGNFTNWDLAKRPDSGWLCAACLVAFKDETLRKQSWAASLEEGLTLFGSQDPRLYDTLLEPPSPPFAIGIRPPGATTAKHMAIRARVNHSRDLYWVQYGEDTVLLSREMLSTWDAALKRLIALGAEYGQIANGRYRANTRNAIDAEAPEARETLLRARESYPMPFEVFMRAAWGLFPKEKDKEAD